MFEKIRPMIAEKLSLEESDVSLQSSFKNDLGADSLDLFEMVMDIEDQFDIEIPTEDLETIDTVEDIVKYLNSKGIE
ncbi:MAG: acyl carrier protein [Clostridiales bacterium]|nr:acyl carrier protein [Clostridiales bacterium]